LQGQLQGQHQSSHNTNNNDNSNSNNASQNVTVDTHNERAPVNTAYAAPLVSGEDTCMGSSSLGGQAVGFGLSIGTTWTDTNCQRLKNSRQLASLGFTRAAVALVCVDEDVQNAMTAAGTPCPGARRAEAEPVAEPRHHEAARETSEPRVAEYAPTQGSVPVYPVAPAYHFEPMKPIND